MYYTIYIHYVQVSGQDLDHDKQWNKLFCKIYIYPKRPNWEDNYDYGWWDVIS